MLAQIPHASRPKNKNIKQEQHCNRFNKDLKKKKIPKKKKCKKAIWLSEEALQVAVKRREAKDKGEREKRKDMPI